MHPASPKPQRRRDDSVSDSLSSLLPLSPLPHDGKLDILDHAAVAIAAALAAYHDTDDDECDTDDVASDDDTGYHTGLADHSDRIDALITTNLGVVGDSPWTADSGIGQDIFEHSRPNNHESSPGPQTRDYPQHHKVDKLQHHSCCHPPDFHYPYLHHQTTQAEPDSHLIPNTAETHHHHYTDSLKLPFGHTLDQESHDQDISDSDDGGVPLDDLASAVSGVLTGGAYFEADSDESIHPVAQDDDEFPESTDLGFYNLPSTFYLELPNAQAAPWMMDTEPATGLLDGEIPGSPSSPPPLPEQPPQPQQDLPMFDLFIDDLAPVQLSNPNPTIPGSENLGLVDFLRSWAYQGRLHGSVTKSRPPLLPEVLRQADTQVGDVRYSDLKGNHLDLQGLNWAAMETTREAARTRRRVTYNNYVNRFGSDAWLPHMDDARISRKENFFRFRRMNMRQDVSLAHFQLRSVLACPSRTHAFYPNLGGITRLNTVSRKTDMLMNSREFPTMGTAVSTLDANCGVLMAGTFSGNYYLQALDAIDKKRFAEGQISGDINGITNHIRVYTPRRSSGPVAAIASNDNFLRVMDIETENVIAHTEYPFALNCSAISPDGRLRVIVGDDLDVLVTNADTGEILQKLSGHRDYGFACDWSDDGWTVATGCQDKGVKIWDARMWRNSSGISTPLCTIRSEMAGVRNLRFSPIGSGKPILVAAEEADYINIIDAQTFSSKQTIDVFGEIGGVAFNDDAQTLNILCCDSHRGGLLQFDRCGRGPEPLLESIWPPHRARPYPNGPNRSKADSQRLLATSLLHGHEPF